MDSPAGRQSKDAPEQDQEQKEAGTPNNAPTRKSLFSPGFFETLDTINGTLAKRDKPAKRNQSEPSTGIRSIVSGRMDKIRALLSDVDSERPPSSIRMDNTAISANLEKARKNAKEASAATARALGHVQTMSYKFDKLNGESMEIIEPFSAEQVRDKLKGAGTRPYVNPLRDIDTQPVKPSVCENTRRALGQLWTDYLKKSQDAKNRFLKDLSDKDILLLLGKNSPEGLVREVATFVNQQSPQQIPNYIKNGPSVIRIQFYTVTKQFGAAIEPINDLLSEKRPEEHGFLLTRKGDCHGHNKYKRIDTWENAAKMTIQNGDLKKTHPHDYPAADTDEVYHKLALAYLEEGHKGPAVNMILLAHRKSECQADKQYYNALLQHMSGDTPKAIEDATELAKGGHRGAINLVMEAHQAAYSNANSTFEKLEIRRKALDILHHLVRQTACRDLHKKFVDSFPL